MTLFNDILIRHDGGVIKKGFFMSDEKINYYAMVCSAICDIINNSKADERRVLESFTQAFGDNASNPYNLINFFAEYICSQIRDEDL